MLFTHTWQWLFGPSPHTGLLKTQTRRLVKSGQNWADDYYGNDVKTVVWDRNCRFVYVVGKTYAIQPGRGKFSIGRLTIKHISREDVRKISPQDVIAEGFANKNHFISTWMDMHDKGFKKVMQACFDDGECWDFINHRPADHYQAWVLHIAVCGNEKRR